MSLWKIDDEKSGDHWLELSDADVSSETWRAIAKWDACCHLYREPTDNPDPDEKLYIHLCGVRDIENWIARLQELLVVAKAYHQEHGNEEWWGRLE